MSEAMSEENGCETIGAGKLSVNGNSQFEGVHTLHKSNFITDLRKSKRRSRDDGEDDEGEDML